MRHFVYAFSIDEAVIVLCKHLQEKQQALTESFSRVKRNKKRFAKEKE